jgi:hypothetical protein
MALAFAQTLLQFLDSLPEPLIPVSLHARCAQIKSRDEAFEVRWPVVLRQLGTMIPNFCSSSMNYQASLLT